MGWGETFQTTSYPSLCLLQPLPLPLLLKLVDPGDLPFLMAVFRHIHPAACGPCSVLNKCVKKNVRWRCRGSSLAFRRRSSTRNHGPAGDQSGALADKPIKSLCGTTYINTGKRNKKKEVPSVPDYIMVSLPFSSLRASITNVNTDLRCSQNCNAKCLTSCMAVQPEKRVCFPSWPSYFTLLAFLAFWGGFIYIGVLSFKDGLFLHYPKLQQMANPFTLEGSQSR